MGLLLRDCYDFGISNVPGPNLGIPLVFHQGRDTIEDTLRKAVAAAEEVFVGRGKPTIIFVCLPVAGECAHIACWNRRPCLVGVAAGPSLLDVALGRPMLGHSLPGDSALGQGVDKRSERMTGHHLYG